MGTTVLDPGPSSGPGLHVYAHCLRALSGGVALLAAMLGTPELTRLAPGSIANLNRFDEHGHLIATYIRGLKV